MANKKFIPICLMATLLAGCQSTTPSTGNALLDYMNTLEVGELKRKDVNKIFTNNLLNSNDKLVKDASYQELVYEPYWALSEGLEESEYAEYVKKSDKKQTYKVYDNNVVVCTGASTVYPYDKSTITEDDDDGISKTPTSYTDTATIWHDEDNEKLRYVYDRDPDNADGSENKYSFEASCDFDDYLFDDVIHAGGLGSLMTQAKEDVEDTFSLYAGAWSSSMTKKENFAATKKEDGSVSINFTGDLCMDLYSAEFLWGWEFSKDKDGEYDYEHPVTKESSTFDNMYVDRRIRFSYAYEIDAKGFVTSASACYFSYLTRIYKDSLGEFQGDIYHADTNPEGKLKYPLDKTTIAALETPGRLVDVEYINGQPNPYLNTTYDDGLPYNIDYFTSKGSIDDANKNYNKEELPNYSDYREQFDLVDTGVWVDAYALFMEEH